MDKFNFNSAICTSRSQSERLLALGLKKETADMFYSTILENGDIARVCYEDFWNSNKAIDDYIRRRCIPAWSLHRLLSMLPDNAPKMFWILDGANISIEWDDNETDFFPHKGNVYNGLIDCIEYLIKEGYFNKEYLV